MRVHQILKDKAEQGVITIPATASVAEAATLLSEKRIGSIVVSSDGTALDGILSERDIVRELGRRGPGCMSDSVDALMTKAIVSCSPSDDTVDVLQKMSDGRFRHMPVVEDGKMVGLISIGDVVKARLAQLAMEKDALEGMIMGH
ncbi:CBS domain-containing protein [Actibacterium ureilyticum]|uniref:CBS domain-containing protein n=1 Tax=Actibacterium ureilyticum TaxID=1590614 RepID=UPI000BAAF97F|nr:CBS domain-containing protein [Actibacterium ureilyticum]